MKSYTVTAQFDPEAAVWFVADSDVPGLATGADSLDALMAKLETVIPELLEVNGELPEGPELRFVVHAERRTPSPKAA